ncbi:MAG: GNAT family N-acetyltransferase [Candidatus Eisenbacteria bacterium]
MGTEVVVELREITMENFRECIRMEVAERQRGFVASNVYSLAEAKADGVSNPRAIYAGGTMVGFTMYWFDVEHGTGHIDRLMVGEGQQKRGYGRAAMSEVIRRLSRMPGCARILTSFQQDNAVADALYHSLGFRRTGDVDEGETVVALEVPRSA